MAAILARADALDSPSTRNALDALDANRQLADRISTDRRQLIDEARQAGASWSDIGAALGMTKQGAQDWHRRKIAEQEQHVGDLHDAERARQASSD